MIQLKAMATEKDKIHTMFWLANPFAIDVNILDDKCIQYLFAPEHPRGCAKAAAFDKFLGYSRDSDSIKKSLKFLSTSISNYEKFLYQVEFSEYAVPYTYITPIQDKNNTGKTKYLVHL